MKSLKNKLLLYFSLAIFTLIFGCASTDDWYVTGVFGDKFVRVTKESWNRSLKNKKYLYISEIDSCYAKKVDKHKVIWVVNSDDINFYDNIDTYIFREKLFKCLDKELEERGISAIKNDTVTMYGSYESSQRYSHKGIMMIHSHPNLYIQYQARLFLQDTFKPNTSYLQDTIRPNIRFAFLTWQQYNAYEYSSIKKWYEPPYVDINIANISEELEKEVKLSCDFTKQLLSFRNIFDVSRFLANYEISFLSESAGGGINRKFIRIFYLRNGKIMKVHTIEFGYPEYY